MGQKESYFLSGFQILFITSERSNMASFKMSLFYELYIYYVALSFTDTQYVLGITLSCPSLTMISLHPHNNPEGKNP